MNTSKKVLWPPIPEGDLPDHRLANGKHHIGCIITQGRAIIVASALFADKMTDGSNCQKQHDRMGNVCLICENRNKAWAARVAEVRRAMFKAFS